MQELVLDGREPRRAPGDGQRRLPSASRTVPPAEPTRQCGGGRSGHGPAGAGRRATRTAQCREPLSAPPARRHRPASAVQASRLRPSFRLNLSHVESVGGGQRDQCCGNGEGKPLDEDTDLGRFAFAVADGAEAIRGIIGQSGCHRRFSFGAGRSGGRPGDHTYAAQWRVARRRRTAAGGGPAAERGGPAAPVRPRTSTKPALLPMGEKLWCGTWRMIWGRVRRFVKASRSGGSGEPIRTISRTDKPVAVRRPTRVPRFSRASGP